MKKLTAIRLAIDAIHHQMKEKLWDADHAIDDYGERCKKQISKWEEAVKILREMMEE